MLAVKYTKELQYVNAVLSVAMTDASTLLVQGTTAGRL